MLETLISPTREVPCPIFGLDNDWPATLFILKHEPSSQYACYNHNGIHGLAVFSCESFAEDFGSYIELPNMEVAEVSFDEARRIAQERPLPIVAVMLLDDLDDPVIHYVR